MKTLLSAFKARAALSPGLLHSHIQRRLEAGKQKRKQHDKLVMGVRLASKRTG